MRYVSDKSCELFDFHLSVTQKRGCSCGMRLAALYKCYIMPLPVSGFTNSHACYPCKLHWTICL